MSLLCCSLFSLAHSVRMSFRKHYSLTGNKVKLERLGNISPGRVLPATDLAAQDPGTTNASLPNAAIKCSGEKPTHTYFWHIHITAPQASTSADSSTAENSTIAAMWRLRADLPTAAFVLVPAFIPGRNETTSHVTLTCATDNLSVCFMDPGDFHQWVPLPLAPRHQRTRRTASTSRWVGRGRTGTARVFLWAEGWGCALGSGLCLWEALQSRIPSTFPSARVPRSPAGHPPRLKVGLQPAQGTAGASPGEKHSCTGPRSSPSGGFAPKGQNSPLSGNWEWWELSSVTEACTYLLRHTAGTTLHTPLRSAVFREPSLASFTRALCSHAQVRLLTWRARAGSKSLQAHSGSGE